MAAIDKTYTKHYSEYKELVEWAENLEFICPNGCKLCPADYIYKWDSWEEGKEIPVMNTTNSIDYFLIKFCPLKFVQDRMKEVYGEEFYNSVLNGTSDYDTYVKGILGTKIKIFRIGERGKKINRLVWRIKVQNTNHDFIWYNSDIDNWIDIYELGECTSSICYFGKSLKAVLRKIRKWRLPKGYIVNFSDWHNHSYKVVIK